jgi:Nif-specific regulatory protein
MALSGDACGSIHLLDGASLSLGRDPGNDLCVKDAAVSRRHCTIRSAGAGYEIADLDSHNGTFVNGVPIRRKVMDHADAIRIGNSEFVFLVRVGDDALHLASPVYGQRFIQPFDIEVGHLARDLAALFRISGIVNSIRDAGLLQQELLRLICEVIPAQRGAIVLLADDDAEPSSRCDWSRQPETGEALEIQRSLVHRAVWERSAVLIDTPGAADAAGGVHVLCVPLLAVERTLGVIYLTSSAAGFGEGHVHFLGSVARIAAVTLENLLALDALSSENRQLKEEIFSTTLVGETRAMQTVAEFIRRVAGSDATVLVRGESGTGKEVVGRAIHQSSPRAARPFVALNCAAIPEALLESELFGHEKGAFTGAAAMKKGKLEAAEDGTVFFDEIGELAPLLQAKLLRVLQQREFERLGGTRTLPFRARVLAATNKNLEQAIKAGEFRQDLYYRLNVVSVTLPPLREHREDIPLLTLHFAAKYSARSKRPFKGVSKAAREVLMNYSWPGNVRELENAVEHAIVLGLTDEILPEDLPAAVLEQQSEAAPAARYHAVVNRAKKELILEALAACGGSYPEAARWLGIHPKYLHRLAKNLKLKVE